MKDFDTARAAAIGRLRGTVLEIGAGRGRNFARLHPEVTWIGAEPDRRRRAQLAVAARRAGHLEPPLEAPAESLPLPSHSVDAVLATVVLCSVRDQAAVLAEIARVLRPGGEFVFAEHVAAPAGSGKRRFQQLVAPLTRRFDHGCDPVRETGEAIRRSPLELVELRRFDMLAAPFIVGRAVSAAGSTTR